MVIPFFKAKFPAAFLLPALLLGCGQDRKAISPGTAPAPVFFEGPLYSDCFREVQFQRRGYIHFRDEFDFLPDNELRMTRLWFSDSKCLGAATDVRVREGSIRIKAKNQNGFEVPVFTVSYNPPHFDGEVIKFSARVEERKTEVIFHILQEVTYQSGHTAEQNQPKEFLLRKKAPLF